jgi:hypothetical protein
VIDKNFILSVTFIIMFVTGIAILAGVSNNANQVQVTGALATCITLEKQDE